MTLFGVLSSKEKRIVSSRRLIPTLKIYGLYQGELGSPKMQPKTSEQHSQAGKAARGGDGASAQAASDEVQLALAALTENIYIITRRAWSRS